MIFIKNNILRFWCQADHCDNISASKKLLTNDYLGCNYSPFIFDVIVFKFFRDF